MSDKINTNEYQQLLIEFMLSNFEWYVRSENIIKSSYFNNKFRSTIKFILEYSSQYPALPTIDQIKIETGIEYKVHQTESIAMHEGWYFDNIESFCRGKAVEHAVEEGAKILANGGEVSKIEKMVKDAVLIGLHKDLGIDYFENPTQRLKDLWNNNAQLSTGLSALDFALFGGFNKKELEIFCAPSGGGKSLMLQNMAKFYALQGMVVLVVTLELDSGLWAERIDSMITGYPCKKSDLEGHLGDIELKLKTSKSKNNGELQIKRMIEGATTPTDIRSFVREYQIQKNRKVDVLIIDYLDILRPTERVDLGNFFVKDQLICEEIRGIAHEFDLLVLAASQLGRGAISQTEFDQDMIAGGKSKINTADNVMAIRLSNIMKERGEIQIELLKTRNSSGSGKKVLLQYNNDTMLISDHPEHMKPLGFNSIPSSNDSSDNLSKYMEIIKDEEEDKPIFDQTPFGAGIQSEKPTTSMDNLINAIKNRKNL